MFPRVSRVRSGGKTYEYLRIVASERDEKGRSHQRVIGNLGRLDQLGDRLDVLVEKLRKFCARRFVLPEEIRNEESVTWGPILVVRHLWEELGLDRIIETLCQGRRRFPVAEHAFVLVANRLCASKLEKSEHGLSRWLESSYVCDSQGRRYLPQWLPPEQINAEQRVKIHWDQLNQWYRTLDAVWEQKEQIEKELYLRVRDLFHLKADLVFYDVTSIYFERREPKGRLRRHGHNRDGKPRNVQVLLGVVLVGGFPIASHIFEGNRADKSTVQEVLTDVRDRFGLGDIVFVADKGMINPQNRVLLESLESYHYILGHPGRRDKQAAGWLAQVGKDWIECPRGTRVQEVDSGREGMRAFVVESDERRCFEAAMRERSMARAEEHLKKVSNAVAQGRVKQPDKIGARAARALQKDKGFRYFSYEVSGPGRFRYNRDEAKLHAEMSREGRYILTSDQMTMSPEDIVAHYKELSDIEDGFRSVKHIIEARPVHHKKDDRVCAHLFVAQLAQLLMRQLRHHLQRAGSYLSAPDALEATKSLGVAVLNIAGKQQVLAGGMGRDARHVFDLLGIRNTQPPGSIRTASERAPKRHVMAK
jgi:transposase